MIQVIVTKNAIERTECLELLKQMGYEAIDGNSLYQIAPNIKVEHESKSWQTLTGFISYSEYPQITAPQFLTENTLIK